MPPYGTGIKSIALMPQSKAYLVGRAALPGFDATCADVPVVVAAAYKSIVAVIAPSQFVPTTQRSINWRTVVIGAPTVSIVLQGSIDDIDANYVIVDTSNSGTGETRTIMTQLRFFRIIVNTWTGGTSPSLVVVIQAL